MPFRAARKVRLDVEMLEDRRLLAGHIVFTPPSGVVAVIGSFAASAFVLRKSPLRAIV